MGYFGFKPYVPVAKRRAQAAAEVARRKKQGHAIAPVTIEGRNIASTFWGKAWCTNLEGYSDFSNRLPRGRTYVRNGSVVHLKIARGRIEALVSGSDLYEIVIEIAALPPSTWKTLKAQCAGQIGTLVELLQGKLSGAVMEKVTDRQGGLFPKPKEIAMRCSCPDYAGMCKHVAAAMYGVGNRLDASPELLFLLRGVDHLELIEQAIPAAPVGTRSGAPAIANDDLGAIFGIELGDAPAAKPAARKPGKPASKKAVEKVADKKKPVPKVTAKPELKPVEKAPARKAVARASAKPPAKKADKAVVSKKAPAAKPKKTKSVAGRGS